MTHHRILEVLREGPPDDDGALRPLHLPPMPLTGVRVAPPHARLRLGPAMATAWVALLGLVVVVAGSLLLGLRPGSGAHTSGAGSAGSGVPPTARAGSSSETPDGGGSGAASAAGPSYGLSEARAIPGGITLGVPTAWHLFDLGPADAPGQPIGVIANFDLQARCRGAAALRSCVRTLLLRAGDILLTVSNDETAMRLESMNPAGASRLQVDGMPALLQVAEATPGIQLTGVAAPAGCDAHRAWWIERPGRPTGWLDIEACSSRTDRASFRSLVDAVAASVRFP